MPSMQNVKMNISHPRFIIPGDSSDLDLEFPQCLRKHVQSDSNAVSSEGTKGNSKGSLFAFPQVRWFKALSYFILILTALSVSLQYLHSFLARILKLKAEPHSLGLFGFMLLLLETSRFICPSIMKWRVPLTFHIAHCACITTWR